MPKDGGNLLLTAEEAKNVLAEEPETAKFIFDFVGSQEFVKGIKRFCLWIEDKDLSKAKSFALYCRKA